MSRYFKQLSALVTASLASNVSTDATENKEVEVSDDNAVTAAALNETVSIILAQHRSHGSHGSHSSHSSHRSSGGGASPRRAPPPATPPPPKKTTPPAQQSDPLGQEPRSPESYPPVNNVDELKKKLADEDARKNIIMRMQLVLQFEDMYDGKIDGIMGPETRKAVLAYKKKKGIPGDKVLDAATLNAFGILGY